MRTTISWENIPEEPFEQLPNGLCTYDFFRAWEFVNRLVDSAVVDVLERLGVGRDRIDQLLTLSDEDSATAVANVAREVGVASELNGCFLWLFDWLRDERRVLGDLGSEFGGDGTVHSIVEFGALASAAVREVPPLAPSVELIALAAAQYPEFLKGERDGKAILFAADSFPMWERYFSNDHEINHALNLLGAHVAERLVDGDNLEVLEIGGGLGSAAELLLRRLGGQVKHYWFTDVHPGFLRRGRELLTERFPDQTFHCALVDINRRFGDQRVDQRFDLVYGVNVLHLALDLPAALSNVKDVVAEDGVAVFVEGMRPHSKTPIATEFVFQLLAEFRNVTLDAATRPNAGFLTAQYWCRALERAGFVDVEFIPDPDPAIAAYPNLAMGAFFGRMPL